VPDLPTIHESGVPGFESASFTTLSAPAATPRAIIALLNTNIAKAAQTPEVGGALQAQGTDAVLMTPEKTAAHIRSEMEKWRKVVTAAGVQAE
jgi:tripartite-type tricarboxylate transporter receptor subunit TctC